jgi:membrane associated rhomboid family serine protease
MPSSVNIFAMQVADRNETAVRTSGSKGEGFLSRFTPIIALVALCWAVFVVNNLVLHAELNQYGIIPRRINSLPGIIFAPFLHASYKHLLANSLPLLILGAVLCARSKGEFIIASFCGILFGGGLTWLFARHAAHIGASGLVFCYFGYLSSLAFFRRNIGTLVLSVVCIVAYGGIVRGIPPTSEAVSWESHLAGLVTGIGAAWLMARVDAA